MSRGLRKTQDINNQHITLCLLGASGAGKTSIVLRYVRGGFNEDLVSTIGAAFFKKTIDYNNVFVNFEIWDTAGQERFHSLAPMYYRSAQAALVVYDVTSDESYIKAKQWVKELKQSNANVVIGLAGNKTETDNIPVVSKEVAEEYAVENGLIFYETSAKTGLNVDEIFSETAKRTIRQRETTLTTKGNNSLQLEIEKSKEGSSTCYC